MRQAREVNHVHDRRRSYVAYDPEAALCSGLFVCCASAPCKEGAAEEGTDRLHGEHCLSLVHLSLAWELIADLDSTYYAHIHPSRPRTMRASLAFRRHLHGGRSGRRASRNGVGAQSYAVLRTSIESADYAGKQRRSRNARAHGPTA